jgi:hypothetical protein
VKWAAMNLISRVKIDTDPQSIMKKPTERDGKALPFSFPPLQTSKHPDLVDVECHIAQQFLRIEMK